MVGKSSLSFGYLGYNIPDDHDQTIEDKYKTIREIGGHSTEIGIKLI